jgi:ABC-type bacteriocin/lantibiotic exporter with double-glycine peptidase domain
VQTYAYEDIITASIEFLIREQDGHLSREILLQSLERTKNLGLPPMQRLVTVGAENGVQLTRVRRRINEVFRDAHPSHPWLAWNEGFVAVLETRNGRVRVFRPGRDRRPVWMPEFKVVSMIGQPDAGVGVDWLVAEPMASLAPLRSPDRQHTLEPFERLKALLAAERSTLWVAITYSVVIGLLSLVVPIAVQSLVNTIAFGSVLQPLAVLTVFVFVALGFSAAMNVLRAWVVEILQRSIFARVGTDVTWRLLRVRAEAFDKHHGPELVNRFFDVVTVQKAAAMLLIDGLNIFMQTLIGLILVALYHPLLLAFDVLLVCAMLFIVFVLGRGAVYTSLKESKAKYAFQAWLEQIATHLITFKTPGGAALASARAGELLEEYLVYRTRHFRILLRQIAGSFALQALASSILLGIGGWLVIERQLTIGQLVASEIVVTLMVSGFTKFGKQLEVFYDLQAAVDKLGTLVDLPLEREGGITMPSRRGPASLQIVNVSAGYDSDPVLQGASWDLRAGERLGLMGRHGCGKSTLADILFGLRAPVSGSILLDGVDYRDLPLEAIRECVALVRGVEIFPGTVLENVRLCREDVSYEDACEALQKVGLLADVRAFQKGLDTVLHPSGRPLSQSQACRLMLARAIAGRPRLIILDDALDPVDRGEDRERIASLLFDKAAPWTLLCISERVDFLSRCQSVAVLQNGALRGASVPMSV